MYLLAGSTPQSDWQRILPAFEKAGCTVTDGQQVEAWCLSALEGGYSKADKSGLSTSLEARLRNSASELLKKSPSPAIFPVEDAQDLSPLRYWLNEFPDAHMLLFHSRPESILAEAMEQGDDPQMILRRWQEAAEHLMRAHRRNRRKSLLVDAEAAFVQPEAFLGACKERYGLQNNNPPALDQGEKAPVQEIYKLIAAQIVAQTPGLPELLAEMEASSLPLAAKGTLPAVNCIEAYKDLQKLKHQVEDKLQDVDKENELLLLQLHQVQEELETYYLKSQEESEKREKAEQAVESQQKQVEEEKKAYRALQQLIKEKDDTFKALEQSKEKAEQAVESQQKQVEEEKKAYRALQQSKDKVEDKLQNAEKENASLHLQFHQAQKGLETYYINCQEEREKRERAEQIIDSIRKELEVKEKELAAVQKQLNLLWQSTSWRITAPMRAIVLIFKRPFRKSKAGSQRPAG